MSTNLLNRRAFLGRVGKLGAGLAGASLLASCQPQVVGKVVKETVEVEKIVEVTPDVETVRAAYYGWLFRFQLRNGAAEWEAANPGNRVNILTAGGPEFEKLSLQWAKAETDYDLFYIDLGGMAKFAEAGWLEPLESYIDEEALNDPLPAIKSACTYKGKLYAYPCMGVVTRAPRWKRCSNWSRAGPTRD